MSKIQYRQCEISIFLLQYVPKEREGSNMRREGLLDISFSFFVACAMWNIVFGPEIVLESQVLTFILLPIVGLSSILFEISKLFSFLVVFLLVMFVFQQFASIVRIIILEYDDKIGISDNNRKRGNEGKEDT